MTREWKPGDVAVITEYGDETPAVLVAGNACEAAGHGSGSHWHYFTRNPDGSTWTSNPSPAARPLVVIDPEDREQVARLWEAWRDSAPDYMLAQDNLQQALREFADPTPPKPEEPTGLGAVVEDVEGVRWVRNPDAAVICKWRNADREWRGYDRINAVRVLFPGVEDGAS